MADKIDWDKPLESTGSVWAKDAQVDFVTSFEGRVIIRIRPKDVWSVGSFTSVDDCGRISSNALAVIRNKPPKMVKHTLYLNVYPSALRECGYGSGYPHSSPEAAATTAGSGSILATVTFEVPEE